MKNILKPLAFVLISTLMLSCNTDSNEIFSKIPEINIANTSPLSLKAYRQNVQIVLGYTDGDGDLGWIDPDKYSIYVLDSRLSEEDEYHVPPLAPDGAVIPIQGKLLVELHNSFLLGSGGSETITYTIRMQDRAGNWSNSVTTPSITIIP